MFIFQFLNDKIHNYVLFAIIVHFNIQKLKNKHTFIQTEKAKSSHFDRTRGDKKQIFPTYDVSKFLNMCCPLYKIYCTIDEHKEILKSFDVL